MKTNEDKKTKSAEDTLKDLAKLVTETPTQKTFQDAESDDAALEQWEEEVNQK
jgi:hypothetical protein